MNTNALISKETKFNPMQADPLNTMHEVNQQNKHAYLSREALHKDGHQQIEEHIVSKGHESHKVQGSPVAGLFHAIEEHNIPIFLSKYLQQEEQQWRRCGDLLNGVVITGQ